MDRLDDVLTEATGAYAAAFARVGRVAAELGGDAPAAGHVAEQHG
jgi:hypothetical protein